MMVVYAILFLGLQFSSNFAQGPYRGFVPDLVAERQVGLASGMVGGMRMAGNVGGALIMIILGAGLQLWGPALMLIAIVEFSLALATFHWVSDGPPARAREDRPWRQIALESWGTDLLGERSFLRMTVVRFLFLMFTACSSTSAPGTCATPLARPRATARSGASSPSRRSRWRHSLACSRPRGSRTDLGASR